jgi:hypothetical protein
MLWVAVQGRSRVLWWVLRATGAVAGREMSEIGTPFGIGIDAHPP